MTEILDAYNLFTATWRFYHRWADSGTLTDGQAAQVVTEAHKIVARFGGSRLAQSLVRAVVEEIEQKGGE